LPTARTSMDLPPGASSNKRAAGKHGAAAARDGEYEEVPLEGGGFKRRRVGAKQWQRYCEHGTRKERCKACGGGAMCEHGRERRKCKKCGGSSICEHGRERRRCKECGGASMCEHGRRRYVCKECGGSAICEHGRRRDRCKDSCCCKNPLGSGHPHGRRGMPQSNDDADNAPGHSSHLADSSCSLTGPLEAKAGKRGAEVSAEDGEYEKVPLEGGGFKRRRVGAKVWQYRCEHGLQRSNCKVCGGKGLCEHGRQRYGCKECGGKGVCEHGRRRTVCKECGGKGVCEHGRQRYLCKECGGKGVCEHGRQRSKCKECGGKGVCEHGRQRHGCKECKEPKSQGEGLGEEGAAPPPPPPPPGITSMETVVI